MVNIGFWYQYQEKVKCQLILYTNCQRFEYEYTHQMIKVDKQKKKKTFYVHYMQKISTPKPIKKHQKRSIKK